MSAIPLRASRSADPREKSPSTSSGVLGPEFHHNAPLTSVPDMHDERPRGSKGIFGPASDFLGFHRTYNFPLWVIFGGALFAFCLSRFELFSDGIARETVAPGEWFWYSQKFYNIGLKLHLGGMIPFGLLAVFQFIPRIRQEKPLIHRINGYIVFTALWIGTIGTLMILRRSFGGSIAFQIAMGVLVILTMGAGGIAYMNILRLQIDEHSKWMLRTCFYVSAIITARLIVMTSVRILAIAGDAYYTVWRCDELAFTMKDPARFASEYPTCGDRTGSTAVVAVLANLGAVERHGSAVRLSFPGALWLAIAIHAIGVELYIQLTPREQQRLRRLTYERQLAAGMKNPGSAGYTSDRLGDADPYVPTGPKV